jgi:hypothetical protein
VHAQRHRQGPGQRVEAAIGTLGEQLQQLDQLLAPGACLPEHRQGLIIGRRRCGQGGSGCAQTVGVVEVEQAGGDGAAEALLLGMGCSRQVGRQPAQLAPQGGEDGARAASEELPE